MIAMSEHEDTETASLNQTMLDTLSKKLSSDTFPSLLETLEEGFSNGINRLPRQFNSVGKSEYNSNVITVIKPYFTFFQMKEYKALH